MNTAYNKVYTAITPKRRDCVYTKPFGATKEEKKWKQKAKF